MGIPCLHCPAQHTNGCSLACTASKLAIKNPLLVPYGAAEISYEITFLFLILSFSFFFSILQLLTAFIVAAGMFCVGALTHVFLHDT